MVMKTSDAYHGKSGNIKNVGTIVVVAARRGVEKNGNGTSDRNMVEEMTVSHFIDNENIFSIGKMAVEKVAAWNRDKIN